MSQWTQAEKGHGEEKGKSGAVAVESSEKGNAGCGLRQEAHPMDKGQKESGAKSNVDCGCLWAAAGDPAAADGQGAKGDTGEGQCSTEGGGNYKW